MDFLSRYLEIAFILILVLIVLQNFVGFASALGAIGKLNQGAITAFQGR
jgi:hypothetical protein